MRKILIISICLYMWSGLQAQTNSLKSLRNAIEFLNEKYGKDYPKGNAYLDRLDKITDASSPEYKQLQKEALLDHPHIKGYDWLVEVRSQYWGNHGPINTMFQNGDLHKTGASNFKSYGSRLEVISFKDGKAVRKSILAEEPEGTLRDADVHFDGKKIL